MAVSIQVVGLNPSFSESILEIFLMKRFKKYKVVTKNVMQGKLIAVVYTLRTYWNQFSLGGICKEE